MSTPTTTTTPSNPGAAPANGATSSGTSTTEGGDLIAPGPYRARAIRDDKNVASHVGKSLQKRTTCITVPFEIVNTAKPGQPPSAFAGRTVRYNGYLTDKTVERVIDSLRYAGCKIADDFSDLYDLKGLGTAECDIDVEIETFLPDPTDEYPDPVETRRNNVAWVNPLGGRVMLEAASADDIKGLGGLVKGLMQKAKQNAGSSSSGGGGEKVGKGGKLRDAAGKVIY